MPVKRIARKFTPVDLDVVSTGDARVQTEGAHRAQDDLLLPCEVVLPFRQQGR